MINYRASILLLIIILLCLVRSRLSVSRQVVMIVRGKDSSELATLRESGIAWIGESISIAA